MFILADEPDWVQEMKLKASSKLASQNRFWVVDFFIGLVSLKIKMVLSVSFSKITTFLDSEISREFGTE